ncbi:DegT/DnrJ/EryC1/StrS family aminotransferase [Deinococcus altitudinis]|uniref:DegT/DnrJ/EryC1/StrS family aminotransferase n=1 Tax=Deinococcus altitudinis TaxID=468914 RepID=UPI003891CAE4
MQDFLAQPEVLPDGSAGVLLPAFIGWSPREGSGVFDPVRTLGVRAGFYSLNADLTVDLHTLETALQGGSYRVLVVIHYYGRTETKMHEIQKLAEQYGAILVEDLAHGFYSAILGGLAGTYGAVNLFSLHKMFPTPGAEGGMVAYRDCRYLHGQQETAPELARLILNYDWAGIARVRRAHFQELTRRLSVLPECGTAFELLWPDLAQTDVPQTLPVRILGGNRDQIYQAMNADGYGMVSLYHTLIDNVQEFPEMVALSRTITNFPVHQDMDAACLDGLIASFKTALHIGSPC